jgi:GntR family transcriptional regulator
VSDVDQLIAHLLHVGRFADPGTTPLYVRLHRALRDAMQQDVLGPGAIMPGERELALRLNLSRVTVRKALKHLVDGHVLVQRQGARTSVADRVEKPIQLFSSFSEDMRARGLQPGALWLTREIGAATDDEGAVLGLKPGTEVCRLRRLRTADNVPMALESSIIPTHFLASPDLVGDSLYVTLNEYGFLPNRALQRLRSDIADKQEAKLLNVRPGAPILEIERRCSKNEGPIIEFARSRYRGDAYDFLIELQRPD